MKGILTLILTLFITEVFSQIYFTGASKIRMTGNSKIIIHNPQPNGITFVSGSGIIMDNEDSEVILKIGSNSGTFKIPFVTPDGVTLPFEYNITSGGDNSGVISFSSYRTDINNDPRPDEVQQMDNPLYAINRFWVIKPIGYTVKPTGVYTFTYDTTEFVGTFITESQLTAQRYNNIDDLWLDWLYAPTANTVSKTVTVIISNSEDQYPVWTLTDISFPLPIGLARFVMDCDDGILNWVTYTETNNDRFIVEASEFGYDWVRIDSLQGVGTTGFPSYYTYDVSEYDFMYWRLSWVSYDGTVESGPVLVSCFNKPTLPIRIYPNPTRNVLKIINGDNKPYTLMDNIGKLIAKGVITDGEIDMVKFASGQYNLMIYDNNKPIIFKIIKQ